MADVTVTPMRGTYTKEATAAYWGANNQIIVQGGTFVEIWEESNAVAFTVQVTGRSGGVAIERQVGATGSWYAPLGKDTVLTIDVKRSAAGANIDIDVLVT